MPLEFSTMDDLLDFVSDEGVGSTHAQGYEWFWKVLTPALETSAPATQDEKQRIADCFYVAGDVHDFNNAPLAAIAAYKRALSHDPDLGSAYREIASMQEQMGQIDDALANFARALELSPNDKHAASDLELLLKSRKDKSFEPRYKAGDPDWEVFELLARREPAAALQVASTVGGQTEARSLLCCLGALEDHDEYLKQWRKLLSQLDALSFTHADWFFMPTGIYMKPDFWRFLLESSVQFSGVFTVFDGLDESERYRALSPHDSIRLRLEYYVCAQSSDMAGLKRIHKNYPEWVELSETLYGEA